jgi:sugar phosphate isomerase/epimerase
VIYISTGGFYDQPASETAKILYENGINSVELSGGCFSVDNLDIILALSKKINFQVHNYFPPPEKPFVFNLASLDSEIARLSNQHVLNGIKLGLDLDRPVYSFHAGFLLDPRVSELGKKILRRDLFDRKQSMEVFIDRLLALSEKARILGVELLIENNVISKANHVFFNKNPFLMAEADECQYVMENTPNNVNLLIDVAHLKVSSNSLGFDRVEFLKKCDPWIKAYHLSDNSGLSDDNQRIHDDSWFWPHLKCGLDYYSLEVYGESYGILCDQFNLITNKLIKI